MRKDAAPQYGMLALMGTHTAAGVTVLVSDLSLLRQSAWRLPAFQLSCGDPPLPSRSVRMLTHVCVCRIPFVWRLHGRRLVHAGLLEEHSAAVSYTGIAYVSALAAGVCPGPYPVPHIVHRDDRRLASSQPHLALERRFTVGRCASSGAFCILHHS